MNQNDRPRQQNKERCTVVKMCVFVCKITDWQTTADSKTKTDAQSLFVSVLLFGGCIKSQQHASIYQGRICADNFTYCHTVADQTFHLTQSQYTDTGPTSPSTDPITPGAWQGSHCSANFEVTGMTRPWKSLGTSGIRTQDLPLLRWTP